MVSDGNGRELQCWEIVYRQRVLDASPWLQLWTETVRLPDGRLVNDYYRLEQPDYAVVFAVTDAEQVIGLWRYKHGPRNINLGLPAGYLMPGEFPQWVSFATSHLVHSTRAFNM